jgi:hypothetical protein
MTINSDVSLDIFQGFASHLGDREQILGNFTRLGGVSQVKPGSVKNQEFFFIII